MRMNIQNLRVLVLRLRSTARPRRQGREFTNLTDGIMKLTYKRNVKPGREPGWLLKLTYEVMDKYGDRELTEDDYDDVFESVKSAAYEMGGVNNRKQVRSVISVYRLGETAGGKYPIFIARNDTLIQTFYIS